MQLTVKAIMVLAVRLPEIPLIVTVDVPGVAALLALSVSTLLPVVGLVANTAVTPPGSPEAASVTLRVNPYWPLTVMVGFPDAPWATVREVGEALKVNVGGGVTVSESVVVAVKVPEVPLTVTVAVPVVAELLAVSLSTLLPVVGLVPNDAVTPLGKPDAASVTLPVTPFCLVTDKVEVPDAP